MSSKHYDVSVVISTYNRCGVLPSALESARAQDTGNVRYEVIVVDNNSTDETRQVIEAFIARHKTLDIRYVFEGKQGVSHARNAGIASARAPIVAFFDDDVYVAPDWIANIKRIFDEHPEIGCAGGKVLPQWSGEPPSWLTSEHWSPLALQDHGDAPFYVNLDRQICLISANLAFRREVFERIGVFAPELQRVKGSIGSMEDLELMLRFYQSGGQGLYEPSLMVAAPVELERVTKAYHRKWHTGHGHFYALLRLKEMEMSDRGRLFDVPAHLYKQAMADSIGQIKHTLRGNRAAAFQHETRLRFFAGFFRKRRRDFLAAGDHNSTAHEIIRCLRLLAGAKEHRNRPEKVS